MFNFLVSIDVLAVSSNDTANKSSIKLSPHCTYGKQLQNVLLTVPDIGVGEVWVSRFDLPQTHLKGPYNPSSDNIALPINWNLNEKFLP